MKIIYNKKTQLSIFILIATIVIFLFIFLFTTNFNDKKEDLEKSKTQILSQTNSKLFPLKNNVDYCLEREVKKALLISGMQGGYIYDRGEYYSQSIVLPDMYPSKLINNLKLNWNNLNNKVLIQSHSEVFVPKINFTARNSKTSNYSRTIRDDYEKYILDGFLKCINLDKYKEAGYNIIKDEYIGKILSTNGPKNAKIDKIIGKINDKISTNINGVEYFGKIININIEQKNIDVEFNENIFNIASGINYNSLKVRNLNSTINVNVDFNAESISAQLFFPILIQKDNFTTSYKKSNVDVNVRFKKYLLLAKNLLEEKRYNRSLDYSNYDDLIKSINESIYFRKTSMNNYKVIKTKIIDRDEFKRYVYSIVDNDSKIFGHPYIFNFAYQNSAPIIDLSKISGSNSYFENNSVMLIVAKNSPYNKNIKNLAIDNQWGESFHFIPKFDSTSTYDYSLTSLGELSFTAKIKSRFLFDIELTDGEAIRKQQFVFVSGFLTNENNEDAINCFSFKNYEKNFFPISSDYKNKLYSQVDSSGKTRLYGYALNGEDSIVGFSASCLGIAPSVFDIEILYENLDGTGSSTARSFDSNNEFTIPGSTKPQKVSIEITDKSSGNLVNDGPFEFEIYPAKCLGPKEFSASEQTDRGGTGTCCDLSKTPTTTLPTSTNTISNLITSTTPVIDVDSYFTFNPSSTVFTSSSFDYTNNIFWTNWGVDATSIFEGKLKATCKGTYPKYEQNIDAITSSSPDYSANLKEIFINEKFNINKNINLKVIQSTNKCEFGNLPVYSGLEILTDNKRVFSVGFKYLNNPLNSPVTLSSTDPAEANIMVKCSNNWFNKTPSSTSWFLTPTPTRGKGGVPSTVEVSQGYCQIGSNSCGGRDNINNPTYVVATDDASTCTDKYIDSNGNLQTQVNTGWECDSYPRQTCPGGVLTSTVIKSYCSGNYFCPARLSDTLC